MSEVPTPRLEDLDPTPLAGPTQMTRAHREGLRRAAAKAKAWFKPQIDAETAVKAAVIVYLNEWSKVYGIGTTVVGLTQTERTIMAIRQDTVQQILRELA